MKNIILLNFLAFSNFRDFLIKSFRINFITMNYLNTENDFSTQKILRKSGILLLFLLFLNSNSLLAQAPACNLHGPLKATFGKVNGEKVIFSSESINTVPGTIYLWSLKSNTTNAKIIGKNGSSSIEVDAGTNGGNFTIELKVINPGKKDDKNSCACTQSVSVN